MQQLIEEDDVVELFEGFSEAEWITGNRSEDSEGYFQSNDCQNSAESYVRYFCGSSRVKASPIFELLLDKSCQGGNSTGEGE